MADADNKLGHYTEAEQKARQAVAMHRRLHDAGHPETAWGLITLGTALARQKKYAEAEDALREALAICRKSYGNYHKATGFVMEELVQLLEARGDEVGIRNLMRPALDEIKARTNQGTFASWRDQGRIYTKLGQWDEAIHAFREACGINPSDAAVHFDLGVALQSRSRFDEAIDVFKEYIELKPDDPAGYARLGSCLRQSGRVDDAVASYRKAIDLEPSFGLAHVGLACSFCEQGKFDEAEAATRKAIELSPNDPVAYIVLGRAVHGLGKLDEAHVAWRRGIELRADAYTLIDMAWRLATAPDPEHRDAAWSVKLATKAAELTPKDGTIWSVLGLAEYRAGQLQQAVAALEKAMELRDGGDASDWLVLAMVQWQLGQEEKARTSYENAVQLTKKLDTYDQDLERFRAEAAELLGVTEPKPTAHLKSHNDDVSNSDDATRASLPTTDN
jgi:tetratricopeptide (TPR) repeat protein